MEATTAAAQRESAAAQRESAAAQREAALARDAMEATTAAAQREAAAAQREAALARDAMEATTAAAQRESAAAQQAIVAIKEAADTKSTLKRRSAELLRIKGRLSLRGVIEYLEEEERAEHGWHDYPRKKLWTNIISNMPKLRDCLKEPAVFGRRASDANLAQKINDIYSVLSGAIHSNKAPAEYKQANDKVFIVKNELDERQCRAVECLCQIFGFPYELML